MKYCDRCHSAYPDDFASCPRDQSPLRGTSELLPGMVLRGKYEVQEKLGAGGMASVYRARHRAFGETVAIKVLSPRLADEEDFRRRFHNEAVVARRLEHPSAVRVQDLDTTEDGRPFIVMEFVDGRSLREVIRAEGALAPARAVAIAGQIASALASAHALGIVHRDIKPDNILLTRDPDGSERAKVLDFGISKVKEGVLAEELGHPSTRTGLVVGTPQYLSPEQAMGRRGDELDGRADLYSLGIVLYEMVTGRLPFQSDTAMGVILQHLQTAPTPPHLVRPDLDLPPALSDLLLRAMEKERDRRFGSAEEMVAALQALPVLSTTAPPAPAKTAGGLPETPRPARTVPADIENLPTLPRVPTPASPPPLPATAMAPAPRSTRPRRRIRWWAWAAAIFVVTWAMANMSEHPPDEGPGARDPGDAIGQGPERDEALQQQVEELWRSTRALEDEDVDVDVRDGLVVLSGAASTEAAAELARVLAASVPGVEGVTGRIEVAASGREAPADEGPEVGTVRPPLPAPRLPPPAAPPGVPAPPPPAATALRELLDTAERQLAEGDAQAAMVSYKAALMLDPTNPEALTGLGRAGALMGQQTAERATRRFGSPPPRRTP